MPEQYIDNTFDVENSTYALVTFFIENSFVFQTYQICFLGLEQTSAALLLGLYSKRQNSSGPFNSLL